MIQRDLSDILGVFPCVSVDLLSLWAFERPFVNDPRGLNFCWEQVPRNSAIYGFGRVLFAALYGFLSASFGLDSPFDRTAKARAGCSKWCQSLNPPISTCQSRICPPGYARGVISPEKSFNLGPMTTMTTWWNPRYSWPWRPGLHCLHWHQCLVGLPDC